MSGKIKNNNKNNRKEMKTKKLINQTPRQATDKKQA
jgi:hypothetical protein